MAFVDCIKCGTAFEPSSSRVKRGDYRCTPCIYQANAAWRLKKHQANPNWTPRAPRTSAAPPRQTDPINARAYWMVTEAIAGGKLVRGPCEVCATTKRVEGHHDDYTKPLEVRWLCTRHHQQHHARVRSLLNAAAPDLLAALRLCRDELAVLQSNATGGAPNDVAVLIPERLQQADAAIALATGEQSQCH